MSTPLIEFADKLSILLIVTSSSFNPDSPPYWYGSFSSSSTSLSTLSPLAKANIERDWIAFPFSSKKDVQDPTSSAPV